MQSFLGGSDNVPSHSTAAAARAVQHRNVQASLPLVPSTTAGLQQAQASARDLPFPLEYPRVQDAGGSGVPVDLRDYLIHAGGSAYPAYVAVFSNGLLGQYYDVQGMTWLGAPMFSDPDQTVTVAGRTYLLFYSGQHLMVVAWYAHGAVYWVHNSLTDSVENGELLAIAEQTRPIGVVGTPGSPVGGTRGRRHGRFAAVVVPRRIAPGPTVTTVETIGAIGGVATLLAAPLLCFGLFRRRRRLAALRSELDALLSLEHRLRSSVPRTRAMISAHRPVARRTP